MKTALKTRIVAQVSLITLAVGIGAHAQTVSIAPSTLSRLGTVDERFQSYNIEMVEVTGGRFWKPYASAAAPAAAKAASANAPAGLDPGLFEYRPPINLANSRLRKLAAALGPAYLRVSGTWANTTFFQDNDDPPAATPPTGFNGVLTRTEWKGVVEFARAANTEIVTSFAISPGARDAAGVWTPPEAKKLLDYTHSLGTSIAAAEFFNEPNIAAIGGAPKGYTAADYGRDVHAFRAFIKQAEPNLIFLGPGSSGEGGLMTPSVMHGLSSADLLKETGQAFDVFSYHSYGGVSSRCAQFSASAGTTVDAALSDDWLARPGKIEDFYAGIRDQFEPGEALWLTETAQTACGGDRWASTFLDSFRYLNQLGLLAQRGVQVHMHNTLAASDYGLLDEKTYEPRPNYWSALLWHRFMGTTVLNPAAPAVSGLHVYAHCLAGHAGGVAILAINASREASQVLDLPVPSNRYTLTAKNLQDKSVQLNGTELKLTASDDLPALDGTEAPAGRVTLAPVSITFLAIAKAHNANCP